MFCEREPSTLALVEDAPSRSDSEWTPREIDTRQLDEYSVFATVHWNALDADGQVVRDTWTSYQLFDTPDGWRFLSYTNHF